MDTSQVTDMSQMFANCRSLKELDLSTFKTNKVEDMSQMFSGCSDLRMLNLKNFDTSKVTNMNGMFSGCETLEELDLSKFDTTNVKSMNNMFEATDALKSIKFGEKFVVPNNQKDDLKLAEKTWINIGSGTVNNPKPTDKVGISSNELLARADKGNWVVKPDQEYRGPFTVQITNNIDDKLVVEVPEKVRPDYVGSVFNINVPEKDGFTADKKTISVMTLENKLSSTDMVTYTAIKKPEPKPEPVAVAEASKPASSIQPMSSVQPLSSVRTLASVQKQQRMARTIKANKPAAVQTKGQVSEFNQHIALHPELTKVKVYDANGEERNHVLGRGNGWLSDKKLTIGNQVYYHVAGNDWIKDESVYTYKDEHNELKTRNVVMTFLVDSHAKTLGNRVLGALSTWESEKVAMIKGHKYYQVSEDEFVDAEKVDVINA